MSVNLHQIVVETSCLHIVGSTKTTPNIGVLVGVESIKKLKEQKFVDSLNTSSKRSSRVYRKSQNGLNANKPCSGSPSSVIENPDRLRIRKVGSHGGREKTSNGAVKFNSKHGKLSEGKVETKYSMKWACYGGCLPSILRALETVNDLDEALKPWEDSLNNKERSIILKEQSSWERALEIFEWFKRKGCYEVNVIHYNILIRILGKAHRWDQVESLWNEMQTKRIAPTNSTYGTLIDVYSKGGLKEEALLWLEKMKNQGMEADEVTMGIVVQMHKKAGDFEKAEQFFKNWSSGKLVNGGKTTKTTTKDNTLEPRLCFSLYTYNTLIDTYGKAGQLQEASATFARMLREGIVPNTITFNTMIHICGNHGQLEEVVSLMQKMEEVRCPPDTRTYNILISLHAKHDNINAAAAYFTKMKEIGLKPDPVSYRTLLYAFSIRHMVREAEALVLEMDKRDLDIDEFTQSALTRMYIEAGMLERSWSWFERFHLGGKMSSECYSANIDAYGESGHILEAVKAFVCCQERKKLSVLEFNVMIKAYGVGRKYDKACELFDVMEKHGVLPDKCSYNSLVQILCNADLPHLAKPYVRKMREMGFVSDCIPYCAVISSYVKLGQLKMAEGLYKEMVGFGVQPDIVVFGVLINAFADVGSVKEAMSYVVEMRSAGFLENPIIYKSLIKLYTKVGYLQEAEETYKLLQSSDVGPEVYSSNCMIDLYSERDMVSEAEEVFEDLKRRGVANEFSFAMMLCMYKRLGRYEIAVGIAQKMRELGLLTDVLSYNNVIGLYALDGRLKEAVETFWELIKSSIQPNDSTFRSLGVVLVKYGASKEAVKKLEVARRKDSQSGLHAWIVTLRSMVGVEDDMLGCHEVHPNSNSLVISMECLSSSLYFCNNRSMLLSNCLFPMGGVSILLSNRPSDHHLSKYQLIDTVPTNKSVDSRSFSCIFQEEDNTGRVGVAISKDLMSVAGGRGVLDELEKNLELMDWHMEPSRMTLNRFGYTSSSSLWYELAYTEAKGRIKKGDRAWQIAFGSGLCNSAVWRALRTIDPTKEKKPWMDEIDGFPVPVPKVVSITS